MTPAGRTIVLALELVAEMPSHPLLEEAKGHLFTAADLIAKWEEGHAKTDPADLAPESERVARREMPTLPDREATP